MNNFLTLSIKQKIVGYVSMEYENIKATLKKKEYKFLLYYILLKIGYFFHISLVTKEKKRYIESNTITIPASVHAYGVIIEIFFLELYKKISGYDTILDLGGFIGESALYLSHKKNKKVIVVESDPLHYEYLKKNCHNNSHIITIFGAIGTNNNEIFVNKRDTVDSCNQVSSNKKTNSITVPSLHIQSILSQYNPDIIKMDIEGGEYSIIQRLMDNPKYFTFKAGIVEYHFFEQTKNINILKFLNFLEFLSNKKYQYFLFDNTNKIITKTAIQDYKVIACNVYFKLLS